MKSKPRRAKRLQDIRGDFERGVFLALYCSREQRQMRAAALLVLCLKHGLRGVLFTWPLYAMAMAALNLPDMPWFVFLALTLPGASVSAHILGKGVKEDYRCYVQDRLLEKGYVRRLASA